MIILLSVLEFFCGSLMFSYWLGLAAKKDLKTVGDGNPGAFNLWHAAGFKIGIAGVFLDFIKGYFPLVFFISAGYAKGPAIVPIAIAPVLGHAFSPFLKFKGGKSIAVTFGVWSAVTGFEVSFAYAIILAVLLAVAKLYKRGQPTSTETDAFMVVSGMLFVFPYLVLRNFLNNIILLWFLNFLVLVYTNRKKLYGFIKLMRQYR